MWHFDRGSSIPGDSVLKHGCVLTTKLRGRRHIYTANGLVAVAGDALKVVYLSQKGLEIQVLLISNVSLDNLKHHNMRKNPAI